MKDGPREKMIKYGVRALSDEEVLSILIRSGSKDESVLELSKKILHDLLTIENLSDLSAKELMNYKGIGPSKACIIVCANELHFRLMKKMKLRKRISSIRDAFSVVRDDYYNLTYEMFTILFLDKESRVITKMSGDMKSKNEVAFDSNEIVRRAIILKSQEIILFHNHPSGNIRPSDQDIRLTEELNRKLNNFGIGLKDHIIIFNDTYFSLKMGIKGKFQVRN